MDLYLVSERSGAMRAQSLSLRPRSLLLDVLDLAAGALARARRSARRRAEARRRRLVEAALLRFDERGFFRARGEPWDDSRVLPPGPLL